VKNIVLLSDGTGNSAAKLFKTNVWRLYQALDLTRETEQIAYYDDGVGTSAFKPLALLGGAVGWGLKRNVIDLYTYLCRNYRPGDRIYCFGFSRGAFTIRILIGLVNSQGLVKAATEEELREDATRAFERYRNVWKHWRRGMRKTGRRIARMAGRKPEKWKAAKHNDAPEIAFVGLWDTVSAYGLPIDELTKILSVFLPLSVPDRNPCPIMQRACHALALDDERKTFRPVLWNEQDLRPEHIDKATHIRDEVITQVWFAGVHSDVGGGYAEEHLSLVSLDWMMTQAEAVGLTFDPEARKRLKAAMNLNGMLHDSRKGLGQGYRYLPRDVRELVRDVRDPDNRVWIERPKIHESVFRRIVNSDDRYAPIVLPDHYAVVDEQGNIHDLSAARPTSAPPFVRESAPDARNRFARQSSTVRGLVGRRRWLYRGSALVAFLLAAFPWLPLYPWPACSGFTCWPGELIRWVGGWLPGFLERWFNAYAENPPEFAVLVLAIYLLLKRSALLKVRIIDRMRAIWDSFGPLSIEPMVTSYEPVATAGIRMSRAADISVAPDEPSPPPPQVKRDGTSQGNQR
jgi:uncharacterized protein (DUF2235 family)